MVEFGWRLSQFSVIVSSLTSASWNVETPYRCAGVSGEMHESSRRTDRIAGVAVDDVGFTRAAVDGHHGCESAIIQPSEPNRRTGQEGESSKQDRSEHDWRVMGEYFVRSSGEWAGA